MAVSLVMHGCQQLMLQANASPHDDLHSVDSYLELADAIVAIDETGHVSFKNKRMKEFLQAFWIRRIDTSHTTIFGACLAQIETDKIDAMDRGFPDESPVAYKNSVFSDYASQRWQEHLCRAEMPKLL